MNHGRTGFTLLELLLATALAAMLMVLVLTVTASVRRSLPALQNHGPDERSVARLEDLMQRDVAMAVRVQVGENQLTLEGYGGVDRSSGRAIRRPTRIVYRLVASEGHGYLLRQQTNLDDQTNRESQVELAAAGVRELMVMADSPQPAKDRSALQPATDRSTTRPKKERRPLLRLSVAWEDAAAAPLQEILLLQD